MKIRKIIVIIIIIIFFAYILSAQGISDYEILDIELNENFIVAGSKSGINWKFKDDRVWQSVKCELFGAKIGANLDNIVLGDGIFAVRLEPKKEDNVSILYSTDEKKMFITYKISNAKPEMQLFGYDGFFRNGNYYFAIGDGGVAVLNAARAVSYYSEDEYLSDEYKNIINTDFCVNSITDIHKNYDFLALSPDGKIMRYTHDSVWINLDNLKLQPNEYAIKFINDFDNSSILILTTDTTTSGNEKLYRWSEKNSGDLVYNGDISKAAATPDEFIYILNNKGRLTVREIDGKQTQNSQKRQNILQQRIAESNIYTGYKLTDISIYSEKIYEWADSPAFHALIYRGMPYFIGFASDKGILYSANENDGIREETPFEYFSKEVPIKKGLKEVYAEPGIINSAYNSCTFEYSLSQDDWVTIDILNYNLDFVCRIVENGFRREAAGGEHSTDRRVDKWDGTVNNNGGRTVPPGVYYFRITTQKGHKTIKKVVVARN